MALQSGPLRHKKYEKDFLIQKKFMRLLIFSDLCEHISAIFIFLKVLNL